MKKLLISATIAALLVLLCMTKSSYVELNELFIIIGALTVLSTIFYFVKSETTNATHFGATTVLGFLFSFLLFVVDIAIDHYLYYLPNGNVDGEPLTLAFKLAEFNEGIFIACVISTVAVLVLTYVITTVFSKITVKTV